MKTQTHSVCIRLLQPRYTVAMLALFFTLPFTVSAASVEKRLAALEKLVADQTAEISGLKKELGYTKSADAPKDAPVAATVAPILVRPGGKETKFALGGFIQALAETGGAPDSRYTGMNDRFYVRRVRINVNASFAEHFAAKIEADFGAGSIAASSGIRGQLTDGYVQWNRYPEATIRLGQFKTPFGFEQLFSDTKVFTIERGLVSDRLTVSRQIGGMLTGDVAENRLNYSVGAFSGNGVNTGNNDNDDFMLAGRLTGVLLEGERSGRKFTWTAGINAFSSDDTDTFTGRRSGFGLDTQLAFGPANVQAEWLQNTRDPVTGTTIKQDGFSLMGAWAFDKHWRGVLRFDSLDLDTALGNTETDEWIFGLDYLIKGDDLRLSLNYVLGDQPAPIGRDDRLISRLQVIF